MARSSPFPSSPPTALEPEHLARLRNGLRIMALRALGDGDLANEVAQETIVRALAAYDRGRVNDGASLAMLATGIARNVIADIQRDRFRVSALDGAEERLTDPGANTLDSLVTAEQVARATAALDALSTQDREVLRLSLFDGLTPNEIAARTGEPSPRVRKRKSRAIERLRELFFGHDSGSSTSTGR